jgi:hypothetical protein
MGNGRRGVTETEQENQWKKGKYKQRRKEEKIREIYRNRFIEYKRRQEVQPTSISATTFPHAVYLSPITMMMEAVRSSETSVSIYQTTWFISHVPEKSHLDLCDRNIDMLLSY